ncbi:hypothetical protein [Schaalia sp. lx-260]|uniref:hypothetical protein n=1 Tax=Schaalia sp. lx-260 TaxID=2899082 RepID=UPI001E49F528|nr:hypothetical protein [Schaalia sp. lx-260]MCD4548822.1 hypothetical protein [Schaalia sp. lx-260]
MRLFNSELINSLISTINAVPVGQDKRVLTAIVTGQFNLVKDRSIYYCDDFAIRFSSAAGKSFSNTVLSLSSLLKFDDRPCFVAIVRSDAVELRLINSTFLQKVSHSSRQLREDNIRGSFNGSDILLKLDGVVNHPDNFAVLYAMHQAFTQSENIERLVEATNGITSNRRKFMPSAEQEANILHAPERTVGFVHSEFFEVLESDLNNRTARVAGAIAIASLIENVNLRGRIVEELVTSDDPQLIQAITHDLNKGKILTLNTNQDLGDYVRFFDGYNTATDIKTKVLFLQSAPKAFNIDKLLKFLAVPESVYLFFLIGIGEQGKIKTRLVSIFQSDLLPELRVQHHWAGRNSRGVTQVSGVTLDKILDSASIEISVGDSIAALKNWLEL